MMRSIPHLVICQPRDAEDLEALLDEAVERGGPTLIRYPRGEAPKKVDISLKKDTPQFCIVATGDQYPKACILGEMFSADVVYARYLKPFDDNNINGYRSKGLKIVTIENSSIVGGLGEMIGADFKFGWPDEFIPHGDISSLEKAYGLDVLSIAAELEKAGFKRNVKGDL